MDNANSIISYADSKEISREDSSEKGQTNGFRLNSNEQEQFIPFYESLPKDLVVPNAVHFSQDINTYVHFYNPYTQTSKTMEEQQTSDGLNTFQTKMMYPPHEILDDVMKKKVMRRNSLPFSYMTAEQPLPIISGSFSACTSNQLMESMRLRHAQSLERDVRFGVSAAIGRRAKMEDVVAVVPFRKRSNDNSSIEESPKRRRMSFDINTVVEKAYHQGAPGTKKPSYAFFAVYDGHGGASCAEYARMNLHRNIVNHSKFESDVELAISEGFEKTDKDFEIEGGDPGCGTTACVCLIYDNVLYIANIGDSMAIVCRRGKPVELTTPHTLKVKSERERVEKAGGRILEERIAHPVWNPRLINIGVSRALGDLYFKSEKFTEGKPSGLIAVPEVRKCYLTDADKFILLATDGFWDVITQQEAVDFVLQNQELPATEICKNLTDMVANKASNSCWDDNATVLLVKLKGDSLPSPQKPNSPNESTDSNSSPKDSSSKESGKQQEERTADNGERIKS